MSLDLKPSHAAVKRYFAALAEYGQHFIGHEMAVRHAFAELLTTCGRKLKLTLHLEYTIKRAKSRVIVDGALLDEFRLAHGYWEAKDESDDLEAEVKAKLEKAYPRDNIIFQSPKRAILYQNGARVLDEDISGAEALVRVVNAFFDYKAPHIHEWEQAVAEFSDRIPQLADAVKNIIDEERRRSPAFVRSFDDFYALCRQAINPNLSEDAVERMLIQHLLTERIFERIFGNPDFTRRNVVAAEIEKVIVELTRRAFNRNEFLRPLDRFYKAIEVSAENATGFEEKQAFLNTVYERFFQGYSPKEADTHGIVYTPQPIVNFMVRSVEEILQKEFGRSLGDKGVHILDPFVGTGNFIVRLMQEIKATDLQYKYENELHCNEVMLLPYYIASMNIEHEYFERVGEYAPFPGICLVDTFDMRAQSSFFVEANTDRIEKQLREPIFVVVGNPPYNAWQVNENDNNKNRKYKALDDRVTETYAKSSRATNKGALSDPYVKAIRWASDRIKEEGIVALVTNSGFVESIAADGMRANLAHDFDEIFILDLGGNVRKNPKLSGTTHNVFGIQVGVSVNLFIKRNTLPEQRKCKIHYIGAGESLTRYQKYNWLEKLGDYRQVQWRLLVPDPRNNWLRAGLLEEFEDFPSVSSIFSLASNGLKTNRDDWVYNFDRRVLAVNIGRTLGTYNQEVARWASRTDRKVSLNDFLVRDDRQISWSETLKKHVQAGDYSTFDDAEVRRALYRPFCFQYVYFDTLLNERQYQLRSVFPRAVNHENRVLWCKVGSDWPFFSLMVSAIPDALPQSGSRCFPFYTYDEDGTHRRENITDWALEEFRVRYGDRSITKWDIFHYVYAVLHHPEYRERYAANLRRELPRIPFAACHPEDAESLAKPETPDEGSMHSACGNGAANESIGPSGRKERGPQDDKSVFRALVAAGQRLAEIHVHYERQPEYKLVKTEKAGEKLDWRVTKMRLSKDKTTLIYNQFLALSEIPPETYEYKLGNRSALEWVIDQYQVSTDKRSGITNDPNRADDPQYILRLIGQVITVSLETVKIVTTLPSLGLPE